MSNIGIGSVSSAPAAGSLQAKSNTKKVILIRGGDRSNSPPDSSGSSGLSWDNGVAGFAAAALPSWIGSCLKSCLAVTVALYILNQKHLLPKPLSAIVSKALFWPTLPITACTRLGAWSTVVDDTVIMGGAPFGFIGFPERLYNEYGVSITLYFCITFLVQRPPNDFFSFSSHLDLF